MAFVLSPLVQMLLAWVATGLLFPSICGLVIKHNLPSNRSILEFTKTVEAYHVNSSFWILRKCLSYPRLLWGLFLRSAVYIAWLFLLIYDMGLATVAGVFDVALYFLLHFIANVIVIWVMSKIILRLWRMSKTAKTTAPI